METRFGRITVSRAGGTAGRGAKTYKLALPTAWVSALSLTEGGRRVELSFDGGAITIRPEQTMEEFLESRLAAGHSLLDIRFYDGAALCTRIYADRTAKELRAENCTGDLVKTAFGSAPLPTWADLESFLEERCIPRERAGLRSYLDAIGVDEYEPLAIIQKTRGRMAEDDQWIEVEELR